MKKKKNSLPSYPPTRWHASKKSSRVGTSEPSYIASSYFTTSAQSSLAEVPLRTRSPWLPSRCLLDAAQPLLEAIQSALLLLSLIDGHHSFFQLLPSSLSCLSLLSLLFHRVQAPAIVGLHLLSRALPQLLHLTLQFLRTSFPGVAISFGLLRLRFEVCQCFFERLRQLPLCVKMLLNGPNTSLLILGKLGYARILLARSW